MAVIHIMFTHNNTQIELKQTPHVKIKHFFFILIKFYCLFLFSAAAAVTENSHGIVFFCSFTCNPFRTPQIFIADKILQNIKFIKRR